MGSLVSLFSIKMEVSTVQGLEAHVVVLRFLDIFLLYSDSKEFWIIEVPFS